jgi:hypothetical protein
VLDFSRAVEAPAKPIESLFLSMELGFDGLRISVPSSYLEVKSCFDALGVAGIPVSIFCKSLDPLRVNYLPAHPVNYAGCSQWS